METSMTLPAPPMLSAERLTDPAYTIRSTGPHGRLLVHFDPERLCGGIFTFEAEHWMVLGPLTFREFVQALYARSVNLQDGEDLARWINACTAIPATRVN